MGVDTFMVNLGTGVSVSISVTCDLSCSANIVVADGLPPDARFRLLHPLNALTDSLYIHFVLQLILHMTVPAFHKIDQIEHAQQGQRDVDIAISAGAFMVHHGFHFWGTVKGEAGHLGDMTPNHHSHAAIHENGQEQAFPKALTA